MVIGCAPAAGWGEGADADDFFRRGRGISCMQVQIVANAPKIVVSRAGTEARLVTIQAIAPATRMSKASMNTITHTRPRHLEGCS